MSTTSQTAPHPQVRWATAADNEFEAGREGALVVPYKPTTWINFSWDFRSLAGSNIHHMRFTPRADQTGRSTLVIVTPH